MLKEEITEMAEEIEPLTYLVLRIELVLELWDLPFFGGREILGVMAAHFRLADLSADFPSSTAIHGHTYMISHNQPKVLHRNECWREPLSI
jgi:hypothetical protein